MLHPLLTHYPGGGHVPRLPAARTTPAVFAPLKVG